MIRWLGAALLLMGSSAKPTRKGAMPIPSEIRRTSSRSRVVFPTPGGARMRVLHNWPRSRIPDRACPPTPVTCLAIRMERDDRRPKA